LGSTQVQESSSSMPMLVYCTKKNMATIAYRTVIWQPWRLILTSIPTSNVQYAAPWVNVNHNFYGNFTNLF
jgi:hypothetical protein